MGKVDQIEIVLDDCIVSLVLITKSYQNTIQWRCYHYNRILKDTMERRRIIDSRSEITDHRSKILSWIQDKANGCHFIPYQFHTITNLTKYPYLSIIDYNKIIIKNLIKWLLRISMYHYRHAITEKPTFVSFWKWFFIWEIRQLIITFTIEIKKIIINFLYLFILYTY